MPDVIKNKFINLKSGSSVIIQGRLGYYTRIKDIYVVNKLQIKSKISVCIFDSNIKQKNYLIKNVIIPPNKRFEIPFENSTININFNEFILIESETECDIDAFCNYIETFKEINKLNIEIENQKGQKVTDIKYTEEIVKTDIGTKIVKFEKNENYTDVEDIKYNIDKNKITVYKPIKNKIKVKQNFPFIEFSDRFEISVYNSERSRPQKLNIEGKVKVTFSDNTQWRIKPETDLIYSDWYNSSDEIILQPNNYIINFGTTEYLITIYDDNYLQLSFPLNEITTSTGNLIVNKPPLMSYDVAESIRCRLIDEFGNKSDWFNYNESKTFTYGKYKIEVESTIEYFETFISDVEILSDQLTIFELDNSLILNSDTQSFLIIEEPPTIIVNVFQKASLSVSFFPDTVLTNNPKWRILYFSNIYSNWYNNNDTIKLDAGNYKIEFEDIDTWNKPPEYICELKSGINTKIKGIYTRENKGVLKVSFIIPEKYKQYLSWRIYKTAQNNEENIVEWNNEITFKDTFLQGNYTIEINQYDIEIENPFICYDFNTGGLLNSNYVSIVGQKQDFELLEYKELNFDFSNLDMQENVGYVKVLIQPDNMAQLASWKLTSDNRNSCEFKSGQIVKTPFGSYTVTPSNHIGWYIKNHPQISINEANSITLVNLKYEINGNIRIKIEPDYAKDNARWRIKNTEKWYIDNEEITVLPGSYEIEFNEIERHVTPSPINVSVTNNKVSVESVEYVPYGTLQVKINNSAFLSEILGTPKWKVSSQEEWRISESTIYLAPGDYSIEFNEVNYMFTHDIIKTSIKSNEETIINIDFNGVYLLGVPNKSNVSFYNFNNYKKLDIFNDVNKLSTVNQIIFNNGGKILAVLKNETPFLEIYEVTNFDKNYDILITPPNSGCRSGCFSNDDNHLVISHNSFPYLTIYKTDDWSKETITSTPTNVCNVCTFDTNDTVLVVGYDESPYLKLYKTLDWSEITIFEYPDAEVFSLKYKDDGSILAVGCFNKIYLYDPINSYARIPFDCDEITGTIYGVEFFNNFFIIITSLYFYIYHYSNINNTFVKSTQISAPVTNLNNFVKLSKNKEYLLIGCADDPYLLIYKTSDWSRVEDFSSTNLDYCKKFDLTKDLSNRDYVKIPTHVFPKDGYKGLREYESLVSSNFQYYSITYGPTGCTHDKSQWRLLDSNKELIYDSGETTDLTSHLLPPQYFEQAKTYYWQVRHKSDLIGWSFWSKYTRFVSIYAYIQQPVNQTPINNAEGISETPTLSSSTFTVLNSTDTHIKSEWRIFEYLNGEYKQIYTSGAVDSLTSYVLPSGILKGKSLSSSPEYGWSVRYKGSLVGWSDWSEKTNFKTGEWYIEKPVNNTPANNSTDINENNITFISSEFFCFGSNDSHTHTRYEIYNDNNELIYSSGEISDNREGVSIEYQLPENILSDGEKVYKWRVSYKGLLLGWSEWSDITTFTTRILQQSSVTVNIIPDYILSGRTELLRWKWRVSTSDISSEYINPGVTVQIKASQEIIIEFEEYFGYQTPSSITVSLVAGRSYNYNAIYRLIKDGSIKCTLTPSYNTYWKITSSSFWRPSDYTETNLSYDVYTIEFKELTGYNKPNNRTVTVNSNSLVSISETYEQVITNYYIRVNMSISQGKWYLKSDSSKKYNSGDVVPITVTTGIICFENINGYTKPDEIFFNAEYDYDRYPDPYVTNCLLYNAEYKSTTGNVQVNINISEGKWMLDDSGVWYDSGYNATVSSGSHRINFKSIGYFDTPKYQTPEDISFSISIGETKVFNVTYKDVSLHQIVLMMPQEYATELVQKEDLKYRMRYSVDGKTYGTWSDSIPYFLGYDSNRAAINNGVIKNPKIGFHEFEFTQVSGFTLSKTNYIVEYTSTSVIVGVTIQYTKDNSVNKPNQNKSNVKMFFMFYSHEGKLISIDSTNQDENKLYQELLNSLQVKYAVTDDQNLAYEIAMNKNHSQWSKDWVKINSVSYFEKNFINFTNLLDSYCLFQFQKSYPYFTPTGQIVYFKTGKNFETNIVSKRKSINNNYEIEMYFVDYYNLLTNNITFEILLNPDDTSPPNIDDFNVNIRVKNDLLDSYGDPKKISVSGTIKYKTIQGKNYPYYGSKSYSIKELFGTNTLGWITNDHVDITISGYTLNDVNYEIHQLVVNNGFFHLAKATKI